MARGDYVLTSAEWEAVERWENEGGRLTQSHDYNFDPIGKDYLWQVDQTMRSEVSVNEIGILPVKLFVASDKAKSSKERQWSWITGER